MENNVQSHPVITFGPISPPQASATSSLPPAKYCDVPGYISDVHRLLEAISSQHTSAQIAATQYKTRFDETRLALQTSENRLSCLNKELQEANDLALRSEKAKLAFAIALGREQTEYAERCRLADHRRHLAQRRARELERLLSKAEASKEALIQATEARHQRNEEVAQQLKVEIEQLEEDFTKSLQEERDTSFQKLDEELETGRSEIQSLEALVASLRALYQDLEGTLESERESRRLSEQELKGKVVQLEDSLRKERSKAAHWKERENAQRLLQEKQDGARRLKEATAPSAYVLQMTGG